MFILSLHRLSFLSQRHAILLTSDCLTLDIISKRDFCAIESLVSDFGCISTCSNMGKCASISMVVIMMGAEVRLELSSPGPQEILMDKLQRGAELFRIKLVLEGDGSELDQYDAEVGLKTVLQLHVHHKFDVASIHPFLN